MLLLSACTNSDEMATSEIKILRSFEKLLDVSNQLDVKIDARNIISRDKID